jgi:hypothetical protein
MLAHRGPADQKLKSSSSRFAFWTFGERTAVLARASGRRSHGAIVFVARQGDGGPPANEVANSMVKSPLPYSTEQHLPACAVASGYAEVVRL